MNDITIPAAVPSRQLISSDDRHEPRGWTNGSALTPEQLKAAAKVGFDNADRMQAYFRASIGLHND